MGNPRTSLVTATVGNPGPAAADGSQTLVQPRDFHFAVTWVTLFDHLNLVESRGQKPRPISSPTLALVPVVASPAPLVPQPQSYDSHAAWEMVVPKMIRTDSGEFTPVEGSGTGS